MKAMNSSNQEVVESWNKRIKKKKKNKSEKQKSTCDSRFYPFPGGAAAGTVTHVHETSPVSLFQVGSQG
jgi:hypothetical protein